MYVSFSPTLLDAFVASSTEYYYWIAIAFAGEHGTMYGADGYYPFTVLFPTTENFEMAISSEVEEANRLGADA